MCDTTYSIIKICLNKKFQFEVENSFLFFDDFSNLFIVTVKNNSDFFVQEIDFSLLIGHKEC